MSPLSAIPSSTPVYGLGLRPEMAPPATVRAPGIDAPAPLAQPFETGPVQPSEPSFGSLLGRMIADVNDKQTAASEAVRSVQSGGNVSLHQAVIAMEEASISFQLMVEVRNKLLDAYQEIMRMQI